MRLRPFLHSARYRRWLWNRLWAWRYNDPEYDEWLRLEKIEVVCLLYCQPYLPPLRTTGENLVWMKEYFSEPDLTWKRILKDWPFYIGALIAGLEGCNEVLRRQQNREHERLED